MPIASAQLKTSQLSSHNDHGVPNWKATLLEKKKSKNDHPQWRLEIIKRKKEHSNNLNRNAHAAKKSFHSSVPCLSTFQDELHEAHWQVEDRIVPIRKNPIVIFDQKKKKSMSIEDKNDFMIKKLSHEICRENLIDGEVEYGKGFVGKLLKKFDSILSINNFDETVRGGDIDDTKRLWVPVSCAENRNKNNNSSAVLGTSSKGTALNINNSKLSDMPKTFQHVSPQIENRFTEDPSCLIVSKSDINQGFENICNFGTVNNLVPFEELPKPDQVKITKSVFENTTSENCSNKENMKSLNHSATNSRFYGSKPLNVSSVNGSSNSKNNLPDILLSSSPIKPLVSNSEYGKSGFDNSSPTKLKIGNNSETKENSYTRASNLAKTVNNSVTSRSETVSLSGPSETSVRSFRPGSLVVRPASNAPTNLLNCAPYKDVRTSVVNKSFEGSKNKSRNVEKSKVSTTKTSSNRDVFADTYNTNDFGPESFVVSNRSNVPVTNIDKVVLHSKSIVPEKVNSVNNAKSKFHNQMESMESSKLHNSKIHHLLANGLHPATPSSHAKFLLLDPPKLGLQNEDEIELGEDSTDIMENGMTFLGAGVVNSKSALSKSKGQRRKSVTFLDPTTDAQVFEYPAEEYATDYEEPSNDNFIKPSSGNHGNLGSYRSKMHVDFEFGSSVQDRDSDFAITEEVTNAPENNADEISSDFPTPWSSSMSVDLMF